MALIFLGRDIGDEMGVSKYGVYTTMDISRIVYTHKANTLRGRQRMVRCGAP